MAEIPGTEEVAEYLGQSTVDESVLQSVLDAEISDQSSKCRVDPYTDALLLALFRRVARALELRDKPLALVRQDEFTMQRVGGLDAEIRRYEAPYRRLTVA